MYTRERVLVDAGINDVLNDKSQSNTENVLSNIKYVLVSVINLVQKIY